MPLGMEVGLGPGDFVLDGDPAPRKRSQPPTQVLAHVCCGQVAGWIKMPLGREVGLDPGDIALDRDQVEQLRTFQPMSIVAKRSPMSATAELLLCVCLLSRAT